MAALLSLLKGHPLSLVQAACSIREEYIPIDDYIKEYRSGGDIIQLELHDYHRDAGFLSARMNLDHVRRIDINAVRLARLFAFFDRNNLNYDLLSIPTKDMFTAHQPKWLQDVASDRTRFQKLVRLLVKHAILMSCEEIEQSFTMHSTVQALCRNDCLDVEAEAYIRLSASMICSAIPRSSAPDQELVRYRLLPHAEQLVTHLKRFERETGDHIGDSTVLPYYHRLAILFEGVSQFTKAQTVLGTCLKGRRDILGEDHVDTLHTMFTLAAFFHTHQELNPTNAAQAIELYQKCIAGYTKIFGPDHRDVTDCYNNLATLYDDLGRWAEAKTLYIQGLGFETEKQLLEIVKTKEPGGLDPDPITNLGVLYWKLGEHTQSEILLRYALAAFSTMPGRDNEVATYDLLNNLGLLLRDMGKLAAAEEATLGSLKGKRKAWGEKHESTSRSKLNLGIIYAAQQKYTEAEAIYLEVLDVDADMSGYDRFNTSVIHSLGALYHKTKRYADAEVMFLRAYKASNLIYGKNHHKTADVANNLAVLYRTQKRFDDCELWIQITADAYIDTYGPESLQWASTLTLTAAMKKAQGSIRAAIMWYKRSVEAHIKAVGPDHIETLRVEYSLAVQYEDMGDFENGYPHARRAVAGLRKTAGKGSKELLDAMWVLVNMHMHAKNPRSAVALMKLVVQGSAELNGYGHGMTMAATERLTQCQQKLNEERMNVGRN
jgi:tetratricopeptide (TPR) repeat protein